MTFDKLFQQRDNQTSKHANNQMSENTDSETPEHSNNQTSEHSDKPNVQKSKRLSKQMSSSLNSEMFQSQFFGNEPSESLELNTQTSKHSKIEASSAKSKNKEYTRTTFYLPKKTHQRLKIASINQEEDMSEIVTRLIEDWLKQSDV